MLQHARAGDTPVLGHVADENHGGADALTNLGDRAGRLAHLPHRARRAGHPLRMERLDGIDHTHRRPLGLERSANGLDRGLGKHRHG